MTRAETLHERRAHGKIVTFDEIDDAVGWIISPETIALEGQLIRDEAYWKETKDFIKTVKMQDFEGTKDAREANAMATSDYMTAADNYWDALQELGKHKARVRACQMIRDIYQTNSANTRKPL